MCWKLLNSGGIKLALLTGVGLTGGNLRPHPADSEGGVGQGGRPAGQQVSGGLNPTSYFTELIQGGEATSALCVL